MRAVVPDVHNAGDVDAVDEVHRVRGDDHADIRQLELIAQDAHETSLVAVVQVRVGLVVKQDDVASCGEQVLRVLPDSERHLPGAPCARFGQPDVLTAAARVDTHLRCLEAV